jgi:biotin operon repressor
MAKGGARPGSGRVQQQYKIGVAAARKLQELAKHYGNEEPGQLLEGLVNSHYSSIKAAPVQDDVAQLLSLLTPEPQSVASLAKRLRMTKSELERLITTHQKTLVERGIHLHTATASETEKAIQLPSPLNPQEQTYYSKLSKNLFSVQ